MHTESPLLLPEPQKSGLDMLLPLKTSNINYICSDLKEYGLDRQKIAQFTNSHTPSEEFTPSQLSDDICADLKEYGLDGQITAQFASHTPSPESSFSQSSTSSSPVSNPESLDGYRCPNPNCTRISFKNRRDRDRHVRKHDPKRSWEFSCTLCPRKFYRKDKIRQHMTQKHGMS
jgi:hypothetical protein